MQQTNKQTNKQTPLLPLGLSPSVPPGKSVPTLTVRCVEELLPPSGCSEVLHVDGEGLSKITATPAA